MWARHIFIIVSTKAETSTQKLLETLLGNKYRRMHGLSNKMAVTSCAPHKAGAHKKGILDKPHQY